MAHEVFISHSSHDKATADLVCAALEARGIRCWIAPRDIVPGAVWLNAITRAIDESGVVVLVFSSHANDSVQVVRELTRAVDKHIPIVPFRIEGDCTTENLEHLLGVVHWLDASTPPVEQYLPRLVDAVVQHLKAKGWAAGAVATGGQQGPAPVESSSAPPVTLLLTDIEPATQLWQQDRAATAATATRYDALLRQVLEARGGRVFQTGGEALGAAFDSAAAATAAAAEADRAIQSEARSPARGLRVRMALHTGPAEQRHGEYFGPAVNRATGLLEFCHGGQTLLSRATREQIRDQLPEGTQLREVGEHMLPGATRPEPLFQLLTAEIPPNLTPVEPLDIPQHNLPLHTTPLLGRDRDREALRQHLQRDDIRLVTLTGPGGTGKTRLALHVAADLLDQFADGVVFVALASIREAELVGPTIAQTLGVPATADGPVIESLNAFLQNKRLLLLLDNFEQVVAAAPLVAELLASCRQLKVLVTSRTPLQLRGEWEFHVPPLDVPDLKRLPSPEELSRYAAVELFIHRAVTVKRDFVITNETAPAVAEICHRLDGLPLAIELAAARIKLLPPQAMLARLKRRLPLLTQGSRDLPERHQTLRAAIAWSYELLEESEKVLFQRLAVFVGGFSLEAAEAVCNVAGDLELDLLEGVESLVNKSLLYSLEEVAEEPRFGMYETIREYAWECLDGAPLPAARAAGEGGPGEVEAFRRQHAQWFLTLAEAAEPQLMGANKRYWLDRLEAEHDNLRAALGWSAESGEAELGLRLGSALWRFWHTRGYLWEGRDRLEAVLALPGAEAPTLGRAKALNALGALAHDQGDLQRATQLHTESLAIARECGDRETIGYALLSLGNVAVTEERYEDARTLYWEALRFSRTVGHMLYVAMLLNNLGVLAIQSGEYVEAYRYHQQSLSIKRHLKEPLGVAKSLNNLGHVALKQGEHAQAAAFLEESLQLMVDLGHSSGMADVLSSLARLALEQGDMLRAARLLGKVWTLSETIGRSLPDDYDQILTVARARLGEAAFAEVWRQGQALELKEITASLPPARAQS